jgi:hypothetical protein
MNNEMNGHELDWNDTVEKDTDYVILENGDYDFQVTDLERKRYEPKPGSKLTACPQAVLTLTVRTPDGSEVPIKYNLFLHTMFEGRISQFFIAIGQKKKGEKLQMNWQKVIGATGRAKIVKNTFKGSKGEDITNNQVDKFYEPQAAPVAQSPWGNQAPAQPAQPTQQPVQNTTPFPQQPQANTNFTPGSF